MPLVLLKRTGLGRQITTAEDDAGKTATEVAVNANETAAATAQTAANTANANISILGPQVTAANAAAAQAAIDAAAAASLAGSVSATANQALTNAATAQSAANTAQTTANNAQTEVNAVELEVDALAIQVADAQSDADAALSGLASHSHTLAALPEVGTALGLKEDKTTVAALSDEVDLKAYLTDPRFNAIGLSSQAEGTGFGRAVGAGAGFPTALTPAEISAIIQLLTDPDKIALFRALGVRLLTPEGHVAVFGSSGEILGVAGPLFTPSANTYVRYDDVGEEDNLTPPEVLNDLVANGMSKLEQSVTGNFSLSLQGSHSAVVLTLTGNAVLTGISGMGLAGPGGVMPVYVIQGGAGGFTLTESSGSIFLVDPSTLTDIASGVGAVTQLQLINLPNGTWSIRRPTGLKAILALGNISGNFVINVKDFHTAVTCTLVGDANITGVSGAVDKGPCGTIEIFATQDATGGRLLTESASNLDSTSDANSLTLNTTPAKTTLVVLQGKPDGTFIAFNTGKSY